MRTPTAALFALILATLLACEPAPDDRPPALAATIEPVTWLVERIAGDTFTVATVVGPGESPATYQPTDAMMTTLGRTTLFFRVGVPAETGAWFEWVEEAGAIVDTRTGIDLRRMEGHAHHGHDHAGHDHESEAPGSEDNGSGNDPHIWTAPVLLRQQARTIASALAEAVPDRAESFESNRRVLDMELSKLDAELRERLAPYQGRAFMVFHPAWGYYAEAYGLRQVAVEVEGQAPSDAELTELQRIARDENIRVLFVQPQYGGPVAQAVAHAIDAEIMMIDPLARDVGANLRAVTDALIDSFERSAAETDTP